MDKAFAWLEHLTDFLFSLFPHILVVNANERAVKFSEGRKVRVLEPGVHWYWPFVTEEPTKYNVTRDSSAFATQKLTTHDGKRVGISTVIVYSISDVEKAVVRTNDVTDTLSDIAGAACTHATMSREWPALQKAVRSGEFQDEVLAKVADEMATYGITVTEVRVKDLTETMVVALVGDGFLTPPSDEADS